MGRSSETRASPESRCATMRSIIVTGGSRGLGPGIARKLIDADFGAIAGDEEGVIGESDDGAEAADLVDGVFDRSAGLFVEDGEDFVEGLALRVLLRPAGELLGDEVHEADSAVGIAGDDGVADAADSGVQPLLARVGLFAADFDLA